eukprot:849549-Pyramimonas_sp.AAC.1
MGSGISLKTFGARAVGQIPSCNSTTLSLNPPARSWRRGRNVSLRGFRVCPHSHPCSPSSRGPP